MSDGVLCFAHNNGKIDYLKQAISLAKRVKKHLNLPTTVVTSTPNDLTKTDKKIFDHVIEVEDQNSNLKRYYNGTLHHHNLVFKNASRSNSYKLSPYDKTIVLDTDYIICNDSLKHCFKQTQDFLIYDQATDLCQWRKLEEFDYIKNTGIKFYWATCFFFNKTEETKIFFNLLQHIQKNYQHYTKVYNLDKTFRNDHLFSIGIHMMNGFEKGNWAGQLPGKMFYSLDRDFVHSIKDNHIKVLVEKQNYIGEYVLASTRNCNVHLMNKFSLAEHING